MFFFFITVLSWLGRQLIGNRSATSRGPVPDRSATSCIKSQRGPNEVANQSPISRQPVADQLQNRVATPLWPLRSFWILVAERSQSGCSVCRTEAYVNGEGRGEAKDPFCSVLSLISYLMRCRDHDTVNIQMSRLGNFCGVFFMTYFDHVFIFYKDLVKITL